MDTQRNKGRGWGGSRRGRGEGGGRGRGRGEGGGRGRGEGGGRRHGEGVGRGGRRGRWGRGEGLGRRVGGGAGGGKSKETSSLGWKSHFSWSCPCPWHMTTREAGQRVQPNLSRFTVASNIRTFR